MTRLMAWCVPPGILWTRLDELDLLRDEIRVLWIGSRIHLADLERIVRDARSRGLIR